MHRNDATLKVREASTMITHTHKLMTLHVPYAPIILSALTVLSLLTPEQNQTPLQTNRAPPCCFHHTRKEDKTYSFLYAQFTVVFPVLQGIPVGLLFIQLFTKGVLPRSNAAFQRKGKTITQ